MSVNSAFFLRLRVFVLFIIIFSTFLSNAQCWQQIAAGSAHSVAIKSDGTLWTWGSNNNGQLGIGNVATQSYIPVQVGVDNDWQSIVSVGGNTTYASKTDGTLWGWGSYIGNGSWDDVYEPVNIGLANQWLSMATGYGFTLGLKVDGTLWSWGSDGSGQLGNGSAGSSNVPAQVGSDNSWQTIAAGGSHAMGIKADGTLWVWGSNGGGQLGIGNYTTKYSPFKLGTGTNWQKISGGETHTIASKTDGTAWGWGWGTSGQVGDGTNLTRTSPTAIGSSVNWSKIVCGSNSTIVLLNDGSIIGWGSNSQGVLGNGTFTNVSVPTPIGSDTDWQDIDLGWDHSIATKTNHTLWVTGENFDGQLGIGPVMNINIRTNISCGVSSDLTGNVYYLNTSSSPMNNTVVHLKQNNVTVNQTTTDVNGDFVFDNPVPGAYILDGSTTKAWGGCNATDGLLVLKHFVGMTPLTGLQLRAADVNANGVVNSSDALLITQRYVDIINSFTAGDWLFDSVPVTIGTTGIQTQNLSALCYGDVNGSFEPGAKTESTVSLRTQGHIFTNKNELLRIPFITGQKLDAAAITLTVNYPADCLKIEDAVSDHEGNLVYNTHGNELRIAWFSLIPMSLNPGETMFTLNCRLFAAPNNSCNQWTINPSSQVVDENAISIPKVEILIPEIIAGEETFYLGQNMPNPFSQSTEITYYLPESGKVGFKVFNAFGQEVLSIEDNQQDKGNHTLQLNQDMLPAGVYFYQISVSGKSDGYKATKRMVIE